MNYIYSSISNKQLEYVGDIDSAYGIIKKFDQMYLKESTALQIVCRNNLESIKLKNFSEVTTFFDEFEKAVNELKAAGANITEQEKLRYMLKALPHSYSYIGDLMDVLKEEERNVDYLKSKIKLKSMEEKNPNEKNKNEENNIKSNAFTTDTRKCHKCSKPGHLQKDCYQQNFTDQRGRGGYNRGRSRGRSFYQRGNYQGNYRGTANTSSSHHGQASRPTAETRLLRR